VASDQIFVPHFPLIDVAVFRGLRACTTESEELRSIPASAVAFYESPMPADHIVILIHWGVYHEPASVEA
jgi:hypothetical protein